jgi:hypothetical protein
VPLISTFITIYYLESEREMASISKELFGEHGGKEVYK